MSFTDLEKVKVRSILGRPQVFTWQDHDLESAFESISTNNPAAEDHIRGLLARWDTLDTALTNQSTAGILQVHEIKFNPTDDISARDKAIRAEMRRVATLIGKAFGIKFNGSPTSERGYAGDAWFNLPDRWFTGWNK